MIFELARGRIISAEQLRQLSVFVSEVSIGQIVSPPKFDVLKTSIFSHEALPLGQIFVLRTSNFHRATIGR